MRWRVGVLRSGAEDVAWSAGGEAADWATSRTQTIAALRVLIAAEGCRQEYRLEIDGQPGIVTPGLDAAGRVDLDGLDRALPIDQYWN